MNDYQPKVGDRVMVSEYGPYEVLSVNERDRTAVLLHVVDGRATTRAGTAMWSWLTPAPEPEPDEPTAPGALVRNGLGVLMARDRNGDWVWLNDSGDWERWEDIPSPVTVILADPAEVETLRSQRDALLAQRDEVRYRIDAALRYLSGSPVAQRTASILRGPS